MKLLIDISEAEYHLIKKLVASGEGNRQAALIIGGTPVYEHERLKGEWIEQKNYPFRYNCNICGKENTHKSNFCECCGTDMRKPNCVRCDHFGKCEGCEKGEEE